MTEDRQIAYELGRQLGSGERETVTLRDVMVGLQFDCDFIDGFREGKNATNRYYYENRPSRKMKNV